MLFRSHGAHALPADPVARALARAHGLLPDQGPIGVFVHHNTLHALQHRPFFDGVEEGAAWLGARPYLPLSTFREACRTGRIAEADVRTEITRHLGSRAATPVATDLTTAALWHALMTPKVLAWDRDFATAEERELARRASRGIARFELSGADAR